MNEFDKRVRKLESMLFVHTISILILLITLTVIAYEAYK